MQGQLCEMRESRRMQKSKERADLLVSIIPTDGHFDFRLLSGNIESIESIKLQVTQYGPTRARNVVGRGDVRITSSIEPPKMEHMPNMGIPPIIDGAPLVPTSHDCSIDFISDDQSVLDDVQDEKRFVHLFGEVTYRDVFGDPHRTPFRYIWKIDSYEAGVDDEGRNISQDDSGWERNGPEEDNRAT